MKFHSQVIFSCLISLSIVVPSLTQSPGSCSTKGPFCDEGYCCSTSGFCGNTSAYCAPENCMSQCPSAPPPPPGSCSPKGPFCDEGFCCSNAGFCGTSSYYCAPENCQSQCPYVPLPFPTPPTPPSHIRTQSPDGSCSTKGPFCDEGYCCSTSGFCGNTSAYCAPENCMSQCPSAPPPPPGSCSPKGPFCDEGFCCSNAGFCGTSSYYCAPENCQSQCPYVPLPFPTPPTPPSHIRTQSPDGSCSTKGPFCDEGYCCSTSGFCGNTSAYCAPENCMSQCPSTPPPPPGSCSPKGPFCDEGFCCSNAGFCGTSSYYCAPENCQSQCPYVPLPFPTPPTPPSHVRTQSPDGSCSTKGPFCDEGYCCSTSGFCGNTSAYCAPENCMSQCHYVPLPFPSPPTPPSHIRTQSPDGSCSTKGPFCEEGYCCSTSGFCGNTSAYCAPENCMSQCPSAPPPPPGSCSPKGPFCDEGFCCSNAGFCGTSSYYCAPENCQSQCPYVPLPFPTPPTPPSHVRTQSPDGSCSTKGPFCDEGYCCSTSGFCGNTSAYCAPENCMSQCHYVPLPFPTPPTPPSHIRTQSPDGSCSTKGPFCDEGYCCSTSGFCGNTSAYCAPENCMSQCPSAPPPPPGSCSPKGPFCDEGFCCSNAGFCGTSSYYCAPENCQSQCPYVPLPFPSPPTPPSYIRTQSPDGSCSPQGPFCDEGYCCSNSGYCGSSSAYCAPGNCQSQCPSSPPPPFGSCSPKGPFCDEGFCCSNAGFCGTSSDYCAPGNCQSQCPTPTAPPPPPPPPSPPTPPSPPGEDLSSLIPRERFEYMLRYRNDPRCYAVDFYTYDSFITAAQSFPEFGNTGDINTRLREIAAFFGQTSHETTGGWPTAEGGPYAWGYCYLVEVAKPVLCDASNTNWPCYPGKSYYGRGPIQLSWNYNYGQCGAALDMHLLQSPELVEQNPVTAFKTALWFWMTPQAPKPSSHDAIVGKWVPSACDISAKRLPGYGVITNIINGGLECKGRNPAAEADRIGFYETYCDMFGISYGDNIDCVNQTPFSEGCASVASI